MSGEMRIKLQVFGPSGEIKILDLCDNEEQLQKITVQQLKERITRILDTGELRQKDFRLVFRLSILDPDSSFLSTFGIQHLSVIHIIISMPGGGDGGLGDKEGNNRSMERLFYL